MAREDNLTNFSDEDYLDKLLDSVVNQKEENLLGDLENKLNNISEEETIDIFEDIDDDIDEDIDSFDALELERLLSAAYGSDRDTEQQKEIRKAAKEPEKELPEELSQFEPENEPEKESELTPESLFGFLSEEEVSSEPEAIIQPEKVTENEIGKDDMDELMQLLGGTLEEDVPSSSESQQSNENFDDEELSNLFNSLSYGEGISDVMQGLSDNIEESDESRLEEMLNDMSEGANIDDELADIPVKGKTPPKKKGFFARLFKRDKEESDTKESAKNSSEMDENEKIISEMEFSGFGDLDSIPEKSKKEKKEKKEKVKKVKEKKPKKPKKPKEKKEKRAPEPEEKIPVSVPVVLLMLTCVAGITLLLVFGGAAYDYNSRMDAAVKAFVKKDYNMAYEKLAGVEIKAEDEDFYMQVRTIMYPKRQYDTYVKYRKSGDYYKALNSLIKAVEKYDKYKDRADELELSDAFDKLYKNISKKLEYDFEITVDEARDISYIDNSERYSYEVRKIVDASMSTIEKNIEKENKESIKKATSKE